MVLSAGALGLAACGQEANEPTAATSTAAAEAPKGEVVAAGVFEGASDHVTPGGISVRKAADGYYVVLDEDFSLDGAPDPKVGFGNPDYVKGPVRDTRARPFLCFGFSP